MKLLWADEAWEDYLWWKIKDPRLLKRINRLIDAIAIEPFRGIGKPEPLKHEWSGYWSRRINEETSIGLQGVARKNFYRCRPLSLPVIYPLGGFGMRWGIEFNPDSTTR